jgi:hypothetical protein
MAPSGVTLRALRRLLPSEFRERVFEPALADLQIDEARLARSRWARHGARWWFICECLRLAMPGLLWRRNRLTRLGVALLTLLFLGVLLLQRISYGAVRSAEPQRDAGSVVTR